MHTMHIVTIDVLPGRSNMLMFWSLLLVFWCATVHSQDSYPTVDVQTEYGIVRGRTLPVDNGEMVSDIDVFQGIPYAQDTSGPNRFKKPVRPESYDGVYEAFLNGDACPQSPAIILITNPSWRNFSENCLHVNIFNPTVPHGGNGYPVMVWMYGGGFGAGSNFQYPGHFLATHGVVVVMVNYRLAKFGFAFCGKPECPGNYGMWDQNLAIQYVIENIANFGGDPTQITVFGESAGAASASFHLLSPQSKDLFQRAIMQSGAEEMLVLPDAEPERLIYIAAEDYGCPTDDEAAMMDCLREPSWQQILYNTSYFGTGPNVDGAAYADPYDGFLPKTPQELRDEGNIMRGPILAGHNHDDGALGVPGLVPEALFGCCNRTYYQLVMRNRLVDIFFGDNITDDVRNNLFKAMDYTYAPWPHIYNNYANRDTFVELSTDTSFGGSWNRQVKQHQAIAPTYTFIYNYRGRNTSNIVPEWMGVPHLGELPYVLGFTLLQLPSNAHLINDSTIDFTLIEWTDEDVQHTIFFQRMLTNFAKFGDPTPEPVPNPIGGTTVWPQYAWGDLNVLVISNTSIEVSKGWREKNYAFWDEYGPSLSGQTPERMYSVDPDSEYAFDPVTAYAMDVFDFVMAANDLESDMYFDDLYDLWVD